MKNTRKEFSKLHLFLAVAALIMGTSYLQQSTLKSLVSPPQENMAERAEIRRSQELTQLRLLNNIPSFGFDNLIADWTFLKFLQYFGDAEYRNVDGYGLSANYFEVILDRDPLYYPFYTFLSSSVSIFSGQPEKTISLQEKGLQHLSPTFPSESYFVWRQKGIDEILFLGDAEASAKSHHIAADWAARSPAPSAEEDQYSLRKTAEFLAQNPNSVEAQINAWAQVLMAAPDEKTQAVAIQNIEALGGEIVQDENGQYAIRIKAPAE